MTPPRKATKAVESQAKKQPFPTFPQLLRARYLNWLNQNRTLHLLGVFLRVSLAHDVSGEQVKCPL